MSTLSAILGNPMVWYAVLFGVMWQFLRWFLLTRWLVRSIEHWAAHAAKLLLDNALQYIKIIVQYLLQNGTKLVQELWKYRIGKMTLVLLAVYIIYRIIF